MDSEELLAQLADIHMPAAVSWWPLAPGWWVLAALVLLGAAYLGRLYWLNAQQRQVRQHALAELDRCYQYYAESSDAAGSAKLRFVNEANSVLRRVAMVHFPQDNVASLSGERWISFIRDNASSATLDEALANALSHGRFQENLEVDCNALFDFSRSWINDLYVRNKTLPQPQGVSR